MSVSATLVNFGVSVSATLANFGVSVSATLVNFGVSVSATLAISVPHDAVRNWEPHKNSSLYRLLTFPNTPRSLHYILYAEKSGASLFIRGVFVLCLHCILQMYKWQQPRSSLSSTNINTNSRQCHSSKSNQTHENGGIEETDTKSKSVTYLLIPWNRVLLERLTSF